MTEFNPKYIVLPNIKSGFRKTIARLFKSEPLPPDVDIEVVPAQIPKPRVHFPFDYEPQYLINPTASAAIQHVADYPLAPKKEDE